MAAPVSEVRGRSREDDPGQALQVFHAWAGGEYHDRVQVIRRAHRPEHRCPGVWGEWEAIEYQQGSV